MVLFAPRAKGMIEALEPEGQNTTSKAGKLLRGEWVQC